LAFDAASQSDVMIAAKHSVIPTKLLVIYSRLCFDFMVLYTLRQWKQTNKYPVLILIIYFCTIFSALNIYLSSFVQLQQQQQYYCYWWWR